MPHTVKRQRKKISITNDMLFILNTYQEAISDLSEEQKNVLGLSTEEKFREGSPSVYIRRFREFVTKNKHGAMECYLGAIECNLNEFAYQLKERYLICINCLVEAAGKTAEDAEKEVIDSRYILLRELLLRLVVVALSDEENRKRSGKKLIVALEQFVKAITTEKGEALGLDFKFRLNLHQQLTSWVSDFESAVTTIELIHAPENALTGLVNYLSRIKKATKAHILVQCYRVDSKDALSDDWIEKTYQEFLYGKKRAIVAQVNPLTLSAILPSDVQSERLESIKPYKKRDHISDLFVLLNHTELLYGMVTRLDRMIQASNWVLLLTEKLSFNELIKHLDAHRGICNDRLDVKKADLAVDSKACQVLLAKDYISGENVTRVLPGLCEKLRNLGSHRHHRLMIEQFVGDVRELLVYQERLIIKLICNVPMTQDHLETNQHQFIEHPVAQPLLLKAAPQNLTKPAEINSHSSSTVVLTTTETTTQSQKPRPTSFWKLNEENRQQLSRSEPVLQPSPSLSNLVHEVQLVIPQALPNFSNTPIIEVKASYQLKEGSSSGVSTQETTMTEQKFNRNPLGSHAKSSKGRTLATDPEGELKEEVALVDDPEGELNDINDHRLVNESEPTPWSHAAQVYTSYLQAFFEEYEDVDFKRNVLYLQSNCLESQELF